MALLDDLKAKSEARKTEELAERLHAEREAMDRLKEQGKIRAIGESNFSPELMAECARS